MLVVNRFIFLMMLLQLDWSFCLGKQAEVNCLSPQYLEIGTTCTLICSFHQQFRAALWYNTTNLDEPIIHLVYQNMIKSGTGDSLDHYDVDQNGQLIIKNASIEHEGTFTVAYQRFQNEVPVYINVDVIVIAYQKQTETMEVRMAFVLLILFAHPGRFTFLEDDSPAMCQSPQYLTMGSTSTVQCLFHREFYAVLWYNTTNYREEDPILRYQNMIKSGAGYNAGEFDVHPNGSLIINHVSPSHDDTFRVGYFHFDSTAPTFIDVQLIVTVDPPVPFPVLEICGSVTNKCYSATERPFLECSVRGSRPAVILNLALRTVSGDRDITRETLTIQEGFQYTSRVTTKNVFGYSSLLMLLVCKASGPPGMLLMDESMALVQRSKLDLKWWNPTRIHVTRNAKMELQCTGHQGGFLLWKKVSSRGVQELLMYTVFIERKFTEAFSRDFSLGTNGSLITFDADWRHEGSYFCLFGDGNSNGLTMYEVTIIVQPVPPYPVIDGCAQGKSCALKAEREGNLTCSVTGISPKVQPEWAVLSVEDGTTISFTEQKLTVIDKGETFDLTLAAMYNILEYKTDRVTVECRMWLPGVFNLSSQVDLVFAEDVHPTEITHPTQGCLSYANRFLRRVTITTLSVTLFLAVVVLTSLITIAVYARKKWGTRKRKTSVGGEELASELISLRRSRVVEGDSERTVRTSLC